MHRLPYTYGHTCRCKRLLHISEVLDRALAAVGLLLLLSTLLSFDLFKNFKNLLEMFYPWRDGDFRYFSLDRVAFSYYVNRDTLMCYHKASEAFLQRLMSLYVSSHYKVTLLSVFAHATAISITI